MTCNGVLLQKIENIIPRQLRKEDDEHTSIITRSKSKMSGGTGDQIVSETTVEPSEDQIEPDIDMNDFEQINTLV